MNRTRFPGLVLVTVFSCMVAVSVEGCADDTSNGGAPCQQLGHIRCDGVCIDPLTDNQYCGAAGDCRGANAGVICEPWEVCDGLGGCALSCQPGLVACDGTCIDPMTNQSFCGAVGDCQGASAGDQCEPGEICSGGYCGLTCPGDFVMCDGLCLNPLTDRNHCGAAADCQGANAGTACTDGEICDGTGTCALSCQAGLLECNTTCIDPLTNRFHCGASGDCQGGNAGIACLDGEICNAGICELSCQTGLTNCDGMCTNTDHDPAHCGGCTSPCDPGEACVGGFCVPVQSGTLYFSQDSNSDGLFWIDIDTGAGTAVGTSGVTGSTSGLTYDPVADVLMCSQPFGLMFVPRDGSGPPATLGSTGMEGLGYDPAGQVLYASINGNFFSVDTGTGANSGALSAPGFDAEGLAVDEANGILYAIGDSNNLAVYDITNNSWSTVGNTSYDWDNGGLAFNPNENILYAVSNNQGANLYRIDPATAAAALIGATGISGTHNGGLAFARGVQP